MKISKVKGKNLYRAYVPMPDGSYKRLYGKTKKEVNDKVNELISAIQSGHFVEKSSITYSDWANEWMRSYLVNLGENSKLTYQYIMNKRLIPRFGNERLQDIDHNMIQRYINGLSAEVGVRTVKNIHLVLRRSLRDACTNGYIKDNPADNILLPKLARKEMTVLDKGEVNAFLTLAYEDEYEYADCFEFLIHTGLRMGEFIGITLDAYDPETKILTIDKQYQERLHKFTPPKYDSIRRLVLTDRAAEIIEGRIKRVEEIKSKSPSFDPDNFVFLNREYRRISVSTIRNSFKRVVVKLGKPEMRMHDLRHTFATLSIMSGVDIKSLQRRMGHSDAAFTLNKYTHLTDTMNEQAAEKLNDFIKK